MTTGRLACPPRYATPRNPERPTIGPQLAEVARRLGLTPMPWQQDVFDIAGELAIDSDGVEPGTLFYTEVDNTVPRQQGKTALTIPVAVHRLTVMARHLGVRQTLTYTAQKRQAARKKLERDFAEALRSSRSFREITNAKARPVKATDWKLALNNGSEHIQMGRSFWQIDAPTRTGSHGDTLDLGMIDEAFAHQTDEVEAAMKPAQSTRKSAQLWVYSTAGDAKSYYLWRKVLNGRTACDTGDHGRVAYFEWSAPDDADPGDPATWRMAMPALGLTVSEDFVRSEWQRACRKGPEGIAMFRRAYLNQWPETPILEDSTEKVWRPGVWELVCLGDVAQPVEGLVLGVETNVERSRTAVAVSSASGVAGLIVERPGTGWAIDEVARIAIDRGARVAIAANGPAATLIPLLEQQGATVVPVGADKTRLATGWFYDQVVESAAAAQAGQARPLTVKRNPALDAAVAAAEKKASGDGFVWNRRSGDVQALVALTLACWVAVTDPIDDGEIHLW